MITTEVEVGMCVRPTRRPDPVPTRAGWAWPQDPPSEVWRVAGIDDATSQVWLLPQAEQFAIGERETNHVWTTLTTLHSDWELIDGPALGFVVAVDGIPMISMGPDAPNGFMEVTIDLPAGEHRIALCVDVDR